MSSSILAAPSIAPKRHYYDEEGLDSGSGGFERAGSGSAAKRVRHQVLHHSPSAGRCGQFAQPQAGAYGVLPTTLAAVLALFPDMDERTVTDVLNECSSIDAAIKRLGELRLAASVIADAGTAAPGPGPGAAVAGSLLRSPPGGAACDSGPASGSGTPRGGPETAEQWVDFLVSEMATAKDMQDAKDKAAGCLQRFEAFVARMLKQQPGGDLAGRAAKLAEENVVLKKAVQIQHRQLQERAGLEAENAQLKQMLAQYQEQLRTLEVSNYSLSLHLQKATSNSMMHSPRNPDVF